MEFEAINPDALAKPKGYNNGMKGHGDVLFVAGQVGWNREGRMVSDDFVEQFAQALENVLEVVWHVIVFPSKVLLPVNNSYRTHPKAKMSALLSTASPLACSGLM